MTFFAPAASFQIADVANNQDHYCDASSSFSETLKTCDGQNRFEAVNFAGLNDLPSLSSGTTPSQRVSSSSSSEHQDFVLVSQLSSNSSYFFVMKQEEKFKDFLKNQAAAKHPSQQRQAPNSGRSTDSSMAPRSDASNQDFGRPSSFLRAALYRSDHSERSRKKLKSDKFKSDDLTVAHAEPEKPPPRLHLACLKGNINANDIDQMLRRDPSAATKSISLRTNKLVVDPLTLKVEMKLVKESYTLPLHLAIKYKASPEVIEMLVAAAPSVLLARDGPQRETPLMVMLKMQPDVKLVDALLLKNPSCATVRDRHDNSALHIACSRGVSIDVLKHLCLMYPRGLKLRNFQGKTPCHLLQERTVMCSDEMSKFVWEMYGDCA